HHAAPLRVLLVQELEREVPAHDGVPRLVDAAHAAARQPPEHVVLAVDDLPDAAIVAAPAARGRAARQRARHGGATRIVREAAGAGAALVAERGGSRCSLALRRWV